MGRPPLTARVPLGAVGPLALMGGLCLLLLGGCGSSSFVGQQYTNFTAYYNKFYNAQRAFEEGAQAIREAERPVDRSRYLSVFLSPEEQPSESTFENAIQKSADVLREHPDSKWVDDALLLIGKSYFYQQNYVGAAQKFREALALESAREEEARFWLARTLVTNGRVDEAAEVLRVEGAPAENAWTARMHLVRAELRVRQEEWAAAEEALEQGLDGPLPDGPSARAEFLLGQVRETLGQPEDARRAYRRVQEHDPSYELGFAARLSEIELQGQHGDADEALDRLRQLRQDDKNLENLGEIAIVEARVHRATGQYDEARGILRVMLYGERDQRSLPRRTQGRLHYDLATLYRDAYQDFSRAAAHFDTASTDLSGRTAEPDDRPRLPSAPGDPASQATRYESLAERAREVARMDSLLRIGRMSDAEFRDFVETLRERRRARREARQADSESRARRRRFGTQEQTPAQRRQAQASAAETRSSEAGFLFYQDPTRVQQGRRRFEDTWGDRPRVDNWRRRNAMRAAEAADEAPSENEAAPTAEGPREGPAPQTALDLSAVPRDSASQSQMVADRAVARYELANALFLAAGRPDSAATWYRRILQEDGEQPVARRALYALGEAYRAQGDTTAAEQTYQRLLQQYPNSPLARRARERLGRQIQAATGDPAVQADSAYARAYQRWQEGGWRPALDELLAVAHRYPQTDAAPRALLAAGVLYWQRLQADSLRAPHWALHRHLRTLRGADSTSADSLTVPGDRPVLTEGPRTAGPDSLGAPVDSTRVPTSAADTSITATAVAADTVGADSLDGAGLTGPIGPSAGTATGPATDSLLWSGWDLVVGADTTDLAALLRPDPYPPLRALLTHLTEHYPEAPQVEKARTMLALVDQRTAPADSAVADSSRPPPPRPDTAAVAAADTTAAPTPATDTTQNAEAGAGPPPDTAASDRSPLPAPGAASAPPAERGGRPQAWTLLVEAFPSATAATTRADALRRQLRDRWPVETVPDPESDNGTHLVVVGRFGSKQAATQVRGALEEQLSRRLEVRQMPGGGR